MTSYKGIDYGLGQSNVDSATGIRFGVIAQNSIMPEAFDDFDYYYGEPTCPECGNSAIDTATFQMDGAHSESDEWGNYTSHGCDDYACENCEHFLDSSEVYSDEMLGQSYSKDGYKIESAFDNTELFVTLSPFYTFAQFCSPCAPGAGNLDNPCEDGAKTYCLGHDWFEDGRAPYTVYSVKTGEIVQS